MEKIREEWAAFRAMPLKKKLEHIWIYYRWYLLAGAAVICLLVSIVGTVAENRKETLISGIFINNSTSQEGYAHLMEDYWEFCGGSEEQKAELIAGRTIHFDAEPLSQEDAASFMIVTSMIAAQSLDYIITDEASLDDFLEQEVVMDLREVLPEQSLDRWDAVYSGGVPVALRLESTAFAADYPLSAQHSVVLVIANAQDRAGVARFLEYLMA